MELLTLRQLYVMFKTIRWLQVNSAFHPFELYQMITKNSQRLRGKK